MKSVFKILAFLLVCVMCAGAWAWHEAKSFLNAAPEAEGRQVFFDVPQGAHFSQVARSLEQKGLITNARKFTWLARFENMDNRLQAGRFSLNTGWTPQKTLDALVNGQPALYRVTIPEGLTWWQTGKLLENAGLVRFDDFRQVVTDPEFLRHYGIPFATAEGFLMPDTYLLKKPETPPNANFADAAQQFAHDEQWRAQARSAAGRLVDNFWRKAANVWGQAKPSRRDLQRLATLASIVEKETGIDAERPRVAGVYANRLQKNMLLQADPTVIYGLGPAFSGQLRRSQLDDAANLYNTYKRPGLPLGPICSFGEDALKAAYSPETHDFLYFVAETDGGRHVFSRTLEEHNRAVREYRRQKKSAAGAL